MTISGSLSNALSGLTAAARAAEVASSNVANALTDGYGRREVNLSARSLAGTGSGVRVTGITRVIDQHIITDRQLADAQYGQTQTKLNFLTSLESAIGLPEDPNSLNARISALDGRLVEAASRPDSEPRLQAVLQSTKDLATHIKGVSNEIQGLRQDADQNIAKDIQALNDTLSKIPDLNYEVRIQRSAGRDASSLMDQRQQLVDSISEIIPMRTVAREGDQIALITSGGAILLDGKPAQLGFTPVGVVVPEMTLQSGALSGLTINGVAVSTSSDAGPIAGGRLAGNFEVRDVLAVEEQSRIDAVARNLVERFQNPAVDPTLGVGDAGIFTDGGAAFSAVDEIGLSGRLKINARLDPAEGGAVWRFRDGIGASAQGLIGDASGLENLISALAEKQSPASGAFMGAARSFSGLGADVLSLVGVARQNMEADKSYAQAKLDTLKGLELQTGVDTDQELQQLLMIENAYAANARVIQTVDDMVKTLLGL